jgi:outer membrane protein
MQKYLIIIFFFFLQMAGFAQSSALDDYILIAVGNNLALQQKTYSLQKSMAALKQARSLFLPSISVEARYSRAGGGREIEFPVGDLFNPVYSSLNNILSTMGQPTQNFPTLQNETIPFLRKEEQETKIRLVQPIFQPAIYYNYKIKNNLVSADSAAWAAYKTELIADVKSAYYSFLQAEKAVLIYNNALNLVEENVIVSQSLVTNGLATKDVLYRARSEKLQIEQEIIHAQRQNQTARNYFNFLLNRDLNTEILSDSIGFVNNFAEYTPESAAEKALISRKEIEQINQALQARDKNISVETARFFPQVNMVVDYGFQGEKYRFGKEDDYWMASAVLSWNLFNGFGDKARREEAQIEYNILQNDLKQLKQHIRLAAHDAVWALQESEKQFAQSKEQLKAAAEVYSIVSKKYRQGMINQIELIDARTALTNAEIDLSITKFEILKRQARLNQILGNEGV